MVEAIRAAREMKLPFFGICLGMQVAIIEFARNVLQLPDSHSSEFAPECSNPVIDIMEEQKHVTDMGGTMRLGAYPCRLQRGSRAAEVYGVPEVSERHRHRYEVSNSYRDQFVANGLRLSGLSPDGSLVEIVELENHPVVHRRAVPPGTAVAADASASAVRGLHRRRCRGQASRSDGHALDRRWSKPPTDHVRLPPRPALSHRGSLRARGRRLNLRVGEALARLSDLVPGGIIYKASFDKANRSNADAHRGPGMHEGLEKLARVRSATGLALLTDVHLPEQCEPVAQVVDVLQIPAFLCRQTDLLEAAGATGKAVNVKKGQWMAPEAMRGAVEKMSKRGQRSRGHESRVTKCRVTSH